MLRLRIDGAALECRLLPDGGMFPPLGRERRPLVFLHEGLGSLTQWRDFPEQLCRRSGRWGLAFARAGHGRSQPPPVRHGARYLHHEADVVLPEVLARFGLQDPLLVGHSDGASIALIHASGPGSRLGGLVLLAPHVVVEDCTLVGIAAAGDAYRGAGGTPSPLARRLARHHDGAEELFWFWHDTWLSAQFRDWDLRAQLASISLPTLLIQGAEDHYGTMAQLDAIEAGLGGRCRRVELSPCGHSPHLDQPEATLDAITSFLAPLP